MYSEPRYERAFSKKIAAFGPLTVKQVIRRICGDQISSGANRDVFDCKIDPRFVVKIQRTNNFCNVLEWKIWCEFAMTPAWKYFAPCAGISESGHILYMRKAEFRDKKEYPKKVPHFFTDRKYGNYGWIDGRLVCVDYASFIISNGVWPLNKLRRADWWDPAPLTEKEKNRRYRTKATRLELEA
jgi:hypothetical protein